jgi:hypothetical protein
MEKMRAKMANNTEPDMERKLYNVIRKEIVMGSELYNTQKGDMKCKDKISMIAVDFTEFKKGTYRAVNVYLYDGKKKTFATGDPVKDFSDGLEYAINVGGRVVYSSSVDDFVSDDGGYKYDENNMIIKKVRK